LYDVGLALALDVPTSKIARFHHRRRTTSRWQGSFSESFAGAVLQLQSFLFFHCVVVVMENQEHCHSCDLTDCARDFVERSVSVGGGTTHASTTQQ